MALKDRITIVREAAGLSQSDLARACKVDPSAINKLESGDTKKISGELLLKIANACAASPFDIAGIKDMRALEGEFERVDAAAPSLVESFATLQKSEQVRAIAKAIHALAEAEKGLAETLSPQEQQLLAAWRRLPAQVRTDYLFDIEQTAAKQPIAGDLLKTPPLNGTK